MWHRTVKDFTKHPRPLVILTKKEMDFFWGPEQRASMEDLKQAIVTAPCQKSIVLTDVLSWRLTPALPWVSSSYSSGWTTSAIQAVLVLLLGMRENLTTLRQKLKFMASGMPYKHIGFTLSVSKILESKSI